MAKNKKLTSKKGDNGLYGFVDTDGNWVIEPKYEDVHYNGKTEEFEVKINNIYKTIQSDGTLKETSKIYDYITSCRIIQNYGSSGWSFLEASQKDGKWVFDSWERYIYNNDEWYDLRYDDEVEGDVERYYDEVEHNEEFAAWANSLNLQTPEEVAELLWANAQQLIEDAKIKQYCGGDEAPLYNLTLWILLYNQLENIKSLGLMDLRKGLGLPEEDEIYRNPDEIRKIAVKLCAELIYDEDGYEYLDFSELVGLSRTPGYHNYISEYDFNRGDDDDDDDYDDDDDDDDDDVKYEIKDGVGIIPEGTTVIEEDAFAGCRELTEIVIPDSVTEIGEYAFTVCTSLTKIVIPNSVKKIGDNAFDACTSLTKVVIPDSVEEIGDNVFVECTSLTEIVISDSVEEIGDNVFFNCTSLTEIVIPNSVWEIGMFAFSCCEGLTKVVIPDSVEIIGMSAFDGCTSLTEIVIPDSVTEIGECAFENCTSLTEVTILGTISEIGEGIFKGCDSLTTIKVPANQADYYKEHLSEKLHDKIVEMPEK